MPVFHLFQVCGDDLFEEFEQFFGVFIADGSLDATSFNDNVGDLKHRFAADFAPEACGRFFAVDVMVHSLRILLVRCLMRLV